MSYNILRSAAAYQEYQNLVGFFNSRSGQVDSFLYSDPDDNSVTGQGIAIGNGILNIFPMVRSFGGFIEPVLAPNTVSNVYCNGVAVLPNVVPPPGTCSLSYVAGGSLAATTYYVRGVWGTLTGESLPGSETSLAVPANNRLVIQPPAGPPTGATAWVPYVSNTAMGGSNAEQYQNTGNLSTSAPWTEPTTGLVSDGALPATNTTGWSVTTWNSGDVNGPGVLVFNAPIASGVVISADFSYYWPCRMSADDLATSLFMQSFYEVKKFSFISVKN